MLDIGAFVAIMWLAPTLSQAPTPASPCAVWSTAENRCIQVAPTAQARAECAVWSNAENRCLDAPKPQTIDARLATVRRAYVVAVDELDADRLVAICFAERLSRMTPIEPVKAKEGR